MMMPTSRSYRTRPRLLVVDDESANRNLIERIFQRTCDVITATNGREALELLVAHSFDMVLLDIMMPILNGLDVLKIIRSSSDMSELPVILITAVNDKQDIARGIRMGANDYITKPIDIDVVQARVNNQVVLKQLMDERRRMIARLQSANDMRTRMMQVASHDLKNPINNLRILMSIMKRSTDENIKLAKMLTMAEDSLESMQHVIEDFLDSALLNQNDLSIDLRPLDSAAVVRRVMNQYSVAAHHKEIELLAEGISGMVIADASRLAQVISNLISNAIKYSPQGSVVRLRSCVVEENTWRLEVQDKGPGIRPDEREFLFQPFNKNKISTEPTAGEDSTGLGLWIVNEMMTLQEGRVGLDAAPEGGSTFWIELPLARSAASSLTAAQGRNG